MINNVVLVGRLTKDADLRYTASGTGVATFTLAVNRNFHESRWKSRSRLHQLCDLAQVCRDTGELCTKRNIC
jgi:single stranded DNA-binding protein